MPMKKINSHHQLHRNLSVFSWTWKLQMKRLSAVIWVISYFLKRLFKLSLFVMHSRLISSDEKSYKKGWIFVFMTYCWLPVIMFLVDLAKLMSASRFEFLLDLKIGDVCLLENLSRIINKYLLQLYIML